jgi:membrane protease YdiL (CAAX protease family)
MKVSPVKFIIGFICLFLLYHAAEYMILFKNSPAGFIVFQAFFFAAAWVIARWQFKQGLAAWGLSTRKHFLEHLLPGMMMGVILYGLTYFINLFTGAEIKVAVPQLSYMIGPLLIFVFGNFFSSFSEDILTRGYLYKHINGKVNVPVLIFISAAVYLLNHIYRLGDGFVTCLYLFLLGVLFVIPLILTKRLWFTGGMHWAGNSFFYLTHNVIETKPGNASIPANITLCICILLMIPVNYYILKMMDLIDTGVKNNNAKLSAA